MIDGSWHTKAPDPLLLGGITELSALHRFPQSLCRLSPVTCNGSGWIALPLLTALPSPSPFPTLFPVFSVLPRKNTCTQCLSQGLSPGNPTQTMPYLSSLSQAKYSWCLPHSSCDIVPRLIITLAKPLPGHLTHKGPPYDAEPGTGHDALYTSLQPSISPVVPLGLGTHFSC